MSNQSFEDMQTQTGGIGIRVKDSGSRETVITMVLCVLAAICIWFYVMSIDSPTASQVYSSVSVTVNNERDMSIEAPLTPISGVGSVIEVTLKGRKTVLNDLRADDITAYVDVGDVQTAGKNVYPVIVEAPEGTIIEDYYPKEITVYMDKRSIVNVPVQATLKQYNLVAGYTVNLAAPVLSVESVQVTGPESELAKIAYAQLSISPGTITNSFSGTGPLTLVDENGAEISSRYFTLSQTEATAKFYVYTTKTISLSVAYKHGYFAENGTEVTISPKEVEVRGPVETLAAMKTHIVATIDETKITDDGVHAYDINLPDGVELVDAEQSSAVSINIRFTSAKLQKVRIPTTNVEIINVPAGKKIELLDEGLSVSVRGLTGSIMYLTADDFIVVVDAAPAVNNGDQYVSATISVKKGNSAKLYPVGDYSLQLRVSDVDQ